MVPNTATSYLHCTGELEYEPAFWRKHFVLIAWRLHWQAEQFLCFYSKNFTSLFFMVLGWRRCSLFDSSFWLLLFFAENCKTSLDQKFVIVQEVNDLIGHIFYSLNFIPPSANMVGLGFSQYSQSVFRVSLEVLLYVNPFTPHAFISHANELI